MRKVCSQFSKKHLTGYPQVVTLSYNTISCISVKVPTPEQFQDELSKRENEKKNYWFDAKNLHDKHDVFYAVPIPSYITYNALECDFQTNLMFERIKYHQDMPDCNYWAPVAMDFIMAGKAKHIAARREQTPCIHINQFTGYPIPDALKWKEQHLLYLFPTIFGPGANIQEQGSQIPQQSATEKANNENLTPATIAAIIKALCQEDITATPNTQASLSTPTPVQEDNNEKPNVSHKVGLANIAFKKLMTMYGLKPGQEDEIPQLWKELADKAPQKPDLQSIVIDALTSKNNLQ